MLGLGESGFALGSSSGTFNSTTAFDPEDNFTLSCAARNIQGPVMQPYSETLNDIIRVCQSLFFFILFVVGTFLNLLVIVLVAKYKKLRTLSFGIALQIVVINLVLCFLTSIRLASSIANRWVFEEHVCSLVGLIIFIITVIRTASMLVFVIDRFLSVFCPYAYPKYQTKIVTILSIAPWVLIAVGSIIAYVLDCYTFVPTSWSCSINGGCNYNCSIFLGLFFITVTLPITILPLFLYTILFIKAKKIKKEIIATIPEGTDTTNQPKQDWKATITFFLLFMSIFALTVPTLVILSIINTIYQGERVPPAVHVLLIVVSSTISLLPISDPILIMRNRDIREVTGAIKEKIIKKF